MGRLLRAYKYQGRAEVEPVLVDLLTEAVRAGCRRKDIDVIVPVPTHWRRRLIRRVPTVEAMASRVSKGLGIPLIAALRRVRNDPSQVGLSYTKRAENVRGAFAPAGGVTLREPTVLLVDDVRTTGATLNECARVLRRSGAGEVYAAVVARVGFEDKRDVKGLSI